jgi:hypothetical protein
VVRPPVLAIALAAISEEMVRRALLAVLAGITFLAWAWRLRAVVSSPVLYAFSLILLATGIAPAIVPQAYPLHEVWAGLLIALSLAVRRPNAWIAAVLLGVAAAIIRELAAAYLLAMMVMAFKDGCRKEAAAWAIGLVIFAAALAVHAHDVNALVTASDPVAKLAAHRRLVVCAADHAMEFAAGSRAALARGDRGPAGAGRTDGEAG